MIITRTPLRISLFGGGTDYPEYYHNAPNGGAVLGFALDKYVYLTVRELQPFHEHCVRLVYSKIELAERTADLIHPAARTVLQEARIYSNIEITHAADLPARSGLGSSSSFVVGLINALDYLRGQHRSPVSLSYEATRIERGVMKEAGGEQDQIFAAIGDLLHVKFPTACGVPNVNRPRIPADRVSLLLSHLMLAFTGEVRDAPTISSSLNLDPESRHLRRMRIMVDQALDILIQYGPIDALGDLLDEAWVLKQALSPAVTTPTVDTLYARAKAAGAIGGKLLGAGGGGFMLLFARPEDQSVVRAALPELVFVPIGIDRYGSTVVVNGVK